MRGEGWFVVFFCELADMTDGSDVVLALLFSTEGGEGLDELFGEFFLAVLVLKTLFVVGVEVAADRVFAVVEDGRKGAAELEGPPEGLLFRVFLEEV
jgi:hypothetical protein